MSIHTCLSLFAAVLLIGCSDPNPDEPSSSSASSTGEGPVVPPPKIVWTSISTTNAPVARYRHTALWTGSQMLIWGGSVDGMPSVTNTGGLYDPTTDTWKAMSTTGAPNGRWGHAAVWTGSKLLVWGGFNTMGAEASGGIYDLATDTWSPMSTMGQPPARGEVTGVWTGSKLVVWGGRVGGTPNGTGGMYDPATDKWVALNQAGGPSPRFGHAAAWSGKVMMVWGGQNSVDWLNNGAYFDPEGTSSGVWIGTTSSTGLPGPREQHTLVYTNKAFLMWGGWNGGPTLNTGATIDPTANVWTATTEVGAPAARTYHAVAWAGDHFVVFGGCFDHLCKAGQLLADGGQLVPTSKGGEWFAVDAQADLSARYQSTMVYTGDSVIVWGGLLDSQSSTNTGARAPL